MRAINVSIRVKIRMRVGFKPIGESAMNRTMIRTVALRPKATSAMTAFVLWAALTPLVVAASLPGTATVSGTVDSSKPFKAAQVYFRNPARRMLYMVYTVGGHYQAMHL